MRPAHTWYLVRIVFLFQKALISNYYTLTKTKFNYLNKEIIENNYSFTDLKENYIKNILPHEQNLGSEYIPSGENLKMDKIFYNKTYPIIV